MSKKLKLGVVGTGNIFKAAHVKTWAEHPEVEMVAFCDIIHERAETLAREWGVSAVYTDYHELLKDDEIDLIDICTPNLYHSEIAVAALEAGKHVFCEKPDAVNVQEAQRMADAARKSPGILMTMRNNRFRPQSRFLKQFVDEGQMGEIYTGRCGWIRRRGIPGKGGWFTTKALSGGGPLIDLGVHFIDLAMWIMGNPKPVAVVGATYCKFADNALSDSVHSKFGERVENGIFDVEDLAIGFIRFEGGATLQIEFSWASNIGEEMNFVELRGTKAGFSLKKGEVEVFSESAGTLTTTIPVLGKNSASPHGENLNHFVECVQGRAEPIVRPEQGVDMVKILTALYESAESGQEVRLS